jgi:hypothetical protein
VGSANRTESHATERRTSHGGVRRIGLDDSPSPIPAAVAFHPASRPAPAQECPRRRDPSGDPVDVLAPNTTAPNRVATACRHGRSPSAALRDLEIRRVFQRSRALRPNPSGSKSTPSENFNTLLKARTDVQEGAPSARCAPWLRRDEPRCVCLGAGSTGVASPTGQ